MNNGLERVRAVVGPQEDSGLEDSMIKDALWNEYFNVEHAVQWLLGVSGFTLIYYFELMCAQQRNRSEDEQPWNAKVRRDCLLYILFWFLLFPNDVSHFCVVPLTRSSSHSDWFNEVREIFLRMFPFPLSTVRGITKKT